MVNVKERCVTAVVLSAVRTRPSLSETRAQSAAPVGAQNPKQAAAVIELNHMHMHKVRLEVSSVRLTELSRRKLHANICPLELDKHEFDVEVWHEFVHAFGGSCREC